MTTRRSRLKSLSLVAAVSAACVALLPARAIADEPGRPPAVDRAGDDDFNPNLVLPSRPGDFQLKYKTHIGDRVVTMSYLLHIPPGYNKDRGKKHPMLVFLHGIGERGTDLTGIYVWGPMTLLRPDGGNPTFAASFPFIVLCPQCPDDQTWDTDFMYKAAVKLVRQTIRHTRTDADHVYATGLSMGGLGSWCVAEESPDLFAAIAPLSSMAWNPDVAGQKLKYVSVWAVAGMNDQTRFVEGCRAMEAALGQSPLQNRFTYFVDKGHEAWWPLYRNAGFYEWLLSRRRLTAAQRQKLQAHEGPPTTQPVPTAPGHYLLTFPMMIGNQPFNMDYVLYLPKDYKPNSPPHPAMLYLHEQDTIGPIYHDLCVHGPDLQLEKNPALQNNFPFVVISPHVPIDCDWSRPGMTQVLLDLLDHVSQSVNIDADRISVTGLNAGADGAWKLAAEAPSRFAAVVPVVTAGSCTPLDDRAAVMKSIPGRVFAKADDGATADRMNPLIQDTKQDWRLLKLPSTASAIGDIPAYTDRQFLTWLQQQHRGSTPLSAAVVK